MQGCGECRRRRGGAGIGASDARGTRAAAAGGGCGVGSALRRRGDGAAAAAHAELRRGAVGWRWLRPGLGPGGGLGVYQPAAALLGHLCHSQRLSAGRQSPGGAARGGGSSVCRHGRIGGSPPAVRAPGRHRRRLRLGRLGGGRCGAGRLQALGSRQEWWRGQQRQVLRRRRRMGLEQWCRRSRCWRRRLLSQPRHQRRRQVARRRRGSGAGAATRRDPRGRYFGVMEKQ
ncbi:unnamed protein product [Phaeothamnion confervicola]